MINKKEPILSTMTPYDIPGFLIEKHENYTIEIPCICV